MKPLLIDCCIVSNALYFALTLKTQQLNQNLQPPDKNRDNHSTLFYGGQVPWAINSLQQAVFDSAWFDWIYIISMTDRGGDKGIKNLLYSRRLLTTMTMMLLFYNVHKCL